MIARFGGDTVRCSRYEIFGSQELSAAALAAMTDRHACLLANHGLLVAGRDLEQAWPSPASWRNCANSTGVPASWALRCC